MTKIQATPTEKMELNMFLQTNHHHLSSLVSLLNKTFKLKYPEEPKLQMVKRLLNEGIVTSISQGITYYWEMVELYKL